MALNVIWRREIISVYTVLTENLEYNDRNMFQVSFGTEMKSKPPPEMHKQAGVAVAALRRWDFNFTVLVSSLKWRLHDDNAVPSHARAK